jgi:hypothetical protein
MEGRVGRDGELIGGGWLDGKRGVAGRREAALEGIEVGRATPERRHQHHGTAIVHRGRFTGSGRRITTRL